MAGPGSEPFDAVAMKRADAGEFVAGLAHHANVSELGVVHAEHRPAAHDGAHADAGAHRDIGEVVEAPGGAPAPFGERRAVHVGVETHGPPKRRAEPLRDIGVAPAGLGRRRNETVSGRARAQIDRTERGDAQRARRAVLRAPAIEHRFDLAQRFLALAGRQAFDRAHVIGSGAENAHALGAAQFDAGE